MVGGLTDDFFVTPYVQLLTERLNALEWCAHRPTPASARLGHSSMPLPQHRLKDAFLSVPEQVSGTDSNALLVLAGTEGSRWGTQVDGTAAAGVVRVGLWYQQPGPGRHPA